jgi:ABC-type branched-subunit amino acid transport system substrate-binding protein
MNRRQLLEGAGKLSAYALSGGALLRAGMAPAIGQNSGPEAGVSKSTIKIGMTAGITGAIAFASRQFSGYMHKYFDSVNSRGGIHGRKIELTVLDDGGKGNVALQNAQRLIQQEQVFAMTTIGTATTAGILEYLTQQKVPLLFPAAYNTELVSPVRENTFALYQPYEGQIAALTKWALKRFGAGKAVIVRANPPSFDLSAKSAAGSVTSGGGSVEATLNTTYNQPEWASIVIRIKEIKPDYIIAITTAPDMGRMWKELTQQSARPQKAMLGISPLADQAFLDTASNVPDDMIYAAVPGTVVQTAPEAKEARDLMPNEKMGLFGLDGVASGAVMAEAFRQIGPELTREKLIRLLATNFGPFKLPYTDAVKSAQNHLLIPSVSVATVKNGSFVPATSEFVL